MTLRRVLCEGPDDLAAIREIATRCFAATILPGKPASGAGSQREANLRAQSGVRIEVVARSGKTNLPMLAAAELDALPNQLGPSTDSKLKRLGVVFDPDERPVTDFFGELTSAFADEAPAWNLVAIASGIWVATRASGERVLVAAIPWRADGAPADGLADTQNLERVVCSVAAATFPTTASLVERWLDELAAHQTHAPSWKSAMHLWCAAVEPKASHTTAPVRFLGQRKECRPHMMDMLNRVSLLSDMQRLLH